MPRLSFLRYIALICTGATLTETVSVHPSGPFPATSFDRHKGIFDLLLGDCNCRCGIANRDARLLGGEFLRTNEFPWLLLVQVRDQSTVVATLINDRYVITSASPMIGLTPFDVKVTLGQFDRCFPDVNSLNVSISSIYIHPDFSPGNRAHDLALLRLSEPAQFGKRVRPICLSFPGQPFVGQVATIVGWAVGATLDGTPTASCRPRKVGVPVLSFDECVATSFDAAYMSEDKGCVGIVGSRSVICEVDAGNAVVWKSFSGSYELIGTLSDRNDCSDAPSTAMFTKINPHMEWIKKHTKDACYCTKGVFFQ